MPKEVCSGFSFSTLICSILYCLTVIFSLTSVYFSMIVITIVTIPIFVILISDISASCLTHSLYTNQAWGKKFVITIVNVILLGPVIELFIYIVIKIVKSFFSNIWSKLSPTKAIAKANEYLQDPSVSKCNFFIQCSLFGLYHIGAIVLIILDFIRHSFTTDIIYKSTYLLFIGLIPPFIGIVKVFFHAWKVFIYRNINKKYEYTAIDKSLLEESSEFEINIKQNKTKCKWFIIPQELYDPSDLMNLDEWITFLDSPETNLYQEWFFSCKNDHKDIAFALGKKFAAYFCFLLQIGIFFDLHERGMADLNRYSYNIAFLGITFPFSAIVFFTVPFFCDEKFAKMPTIHKIKKVKLIIFIILIISVVLIVIFQRKIYKTPNVSQLEYKQYDNRNDFHILTQKPPLCSYRIGSLDIIQASALNTLKYIIVNPKVVQATLKYITREKFNLTVIEKHEEPKEPRYYVNEIPYNLEIILNDNQEYYEVYGTNLTLQDIGNLEELLTRKHSSSLITSIVPFYRAIYYFLSNLFVDIIRISQYLFAITTISQFEGDQYVYYSKNIINDTKHYVISHGVPAYFVKAFDVKNMRGIMFNNVALNPEYVHANYSILKKHHKQPNMINIYWNNSFIYESDPLIENSAAISVPYSPFHLSNPFEETCYMAALCSTDHHWDSYCTQVLSDDGAKNGTLEYGKLSDFAKNHYS